MSEEENGAKQELSEAINIQTDAMKQLGVGIDTMAKSRNEALDEVDVLKQDIKDNKVATDKIDAANTKSMNAVLSKVDELKQDIKDTKIATDISDAVNVVAADIAKEEITHADKMYMMLKEMEGYIKSKNDANFQPLLDLLVEHENRRN